MGTRIALENLVKNITGKDNTVYSFERGIVTIYSDYATNHQLKDVFPAHLSVEVKPYYSAEIDGVPELNSDLPEEIFNAAKNGTLNKKGIEETIFNIFPHIQLKSMNYDRETNTIYFTFFNELSLLETDLLNDYLNELTPVECKCKII